MMCGLRGPEDARGRPRAPIKKTRWCLLKRKQNLTSTQRFRLRDLLHYNLTTVRAYLLKEDFQQFWEYTSPVWAGKFLDDWCRQTMRSRIEPMKKIAKMLRAHRPLILNYFKAKKVSPAAWSRVSTTRPKSPSENPTVFDLPRH